MFVNMSFRMCVENQEDNACTLESSKGSSKISLNDYCQQHKGMQRIKKMRWKGSYDFPNSRKATWDAGT
jgi:hypothetical protein